MAYFRGAGAYVPPRVVSNTELAERIGKPAEWIKEVSGIEERRWAGAEVAVADLAVEAGRNCLARAGVSEAAIGMVMVASGSAERRFPGPASTVAHRLGLSGKPALDIPMASAGGLFGIALAARLAGDYGNVLVIGAEKMSVVVERESLDPNIVILFGDGAGACIVSAEEGDRRIVDFVLHSDGASADALRLPLDGALVMDGLAVIMNAGRKIPAAISELLSRNGKTPDEVGLYVMHQANWNLMVRVARALKVPEDRFYSNIARYGNTSSASMLIALAESDPNAERAVLAAFGAGFHWGAALLEKSG